MKITKEDLRKMIVETLKESHLTLIPGGGQPEEPQYDPDAWGDDQQSLKNLANEAKAFLNTSPPDIEAAIEKLNLLISQL